MVNCFAAGDAACEHDNNPAEIRNTLNSSKNTRPKFFMLLSNLRSYNTRIIATAMSKAKHRQRLVLLIS
jgi:hypothetical protein